MGIEIFMDSLKEDQDLSNQGETCRQKLWSKASQAD